MLVLKTKVEDLDVSVYRTRKAMGEAAALRAEKIIKKTLDERGEANLVFAAAPSQNEMLDALFSKDIDWTLVRVFQQDEYIGLDDDSKASFRHYMAKNVIRRASFKEVHYMRIPKEETALEEAKKYANLLEKYPPDLIFLGIGENGHLAFNDPPVADFNDPFVVKKVELEARCRQQQVNDGCFASLDLVPTHALTITMSAIMAMPAAVVTVPSILKADAVYACLRKDIDVSCPASILRRHKNAELFLDMDSASKAF